MYKDSLERDINGEKRNFDVLRAIVFDAHYLTFLVRKKCGNLVKGKRVDNNVGIHQNISSRPHQSL